MSTRPVAKGEFHRWCRRCGWKGTYTTAGRGDYAKRKHACEKWSEKLAGQRRRAERLAAVDRTPKACLHKVANHQHGTRAAYVLDRCRCFPCAKANAAAELQRERQKAYGRYDKYVDAAPVREYVLELGRQGMGLKRVAKAAGVSTGTLSKLVFGVYVPSGTGGGRYDAGERLRQPSKRLLRTTAEKLLAVELDLADGVKIDMPVGVPRRIQALVALGWSQSQLAARLGMQRSNFNLTEHRWGITAARVAQVCELYDELSMTPPPENEWRERIAASRARRYARERGWAPPLAWDEDALDDPSAKPDLSTRPREDEPVLDEQAIWRRMHGDKSVRLTQAEGQELRRRWYAAGRTGADLERICGMAPTTRTTERQEAS